MTHAIPDSPTGWTGTFVPPATPRDPNVDREIDTGVTRLAQLLKLDHVQTVKLVRDIDGLKK